MAGRLLGPSVLVRAGAADQTAASLLVGWAARRGSTALALPLVTASRKTPQTATHLEVRTLHIASNRCHMCAVEVTLQIASYKHGLRC